jgi:hypothetical protein
MSTRYFFPLCVCNDPSASSPMKKQTRDLYCSLIRLKISGKGKAWMLLLWPRSNAFLWRAITLYLFLFHCCFRETFSLCVHEYLIMIKTFDMLVPFTLNLMGESGTPPVPTCFSLAVLLYAICSWREILALKKARVLHTGMQSGVVYQNNRCTEMWLNLNHIYFYPVYFFTATEFLP